MLLARGFVFALAAGFLSIAYVGAKVWGCAADNEAIEQQLKRTAKIVRRLTGGVHAV